MKSKHILTLVTLRMGSWGCEKGGK